MSTNIDEDRNRDLIQSIGDWLWEIDENGIYTYSSPQIETILGYTPDEMLGKSPFDFMPSEEAQRVKTLFSEIAKNRVPIHNLENINIHKNGTHVLLETNGKAFFDANARYRGYRGTDRDISKRDTYRFLLDVFGSDFPGVIFRFRQFSDGRKSIDHISQSSSTILGFPPDEIARDPNVLWSQIHPEDLEDFEVSLQLSRLRLEKWDHFYKIITKTGTTKWLNATGNPKLLADNSVSWNCILTDVTDITHLKEQKLRALKQIILALSRVMEARDEYTARHEERVMKIALEIAIAMKLDWRTIAGLELAASIHDIGKVNIPSDILSAPRKLTETEYSIVKTHSDTGANLLTNVDFDWPIAEIIRQHHERIDGSGYPKGLVGNEILIEARILAVADVIEAMSSHRPYRASLGIDEAANEIKRGAGIVYDPLVAETALSLIKQGRIQNHIDD